MPGHPVCGRCRAPVPLFHPVLHPRGIIPRAGAPRWVPRPLVPNDLPAMQDHRSPRLVSPEARDRLPGHRHRRLGPQKGQSRRVVAQEVGGRHQEAPRVAHAAPLCQRRHGGSARTRPDDR